MPNVLWDCSFSNYGPNATSPHSFPSNAGHGASGSIAAHADRVLIGFQGFKGLLPTGLTMSWNSVDMGAAIGSLTVDAGASFYLYVFGLMNPATGANTLLASWDAGTPSNHVMGAVSFYNASGWRNLTTNLGITSADETITIATAAGNIVVSIGGDLNATGRTLLTGTSAWTETADDGNFMANYNDGGSGVMAWTLGSAVNWGMIGVDVIAAGGGGDSALEESNYSILEAQTNPLIVGVW